ncbi:uncharacterized protein LOC107428605 [Ziziphus jujuba]|uniref:Uncharacterized protein LOC107428605 n=1 Tax=Ziziphus jujuba TaxID=326968 RepID=A0A6P4AZ63_ZIZJJ|nr:uncharacterized protein LOC107428605 [Ziziphus jujuba]
MCVRLFGLPRQVGRGTVKREEFIEPSTDRECGRKKDATESHISVDVSSNSKGISVRIIHAGRREELYYNAVPASQLMKKYPGMCIARPDVFKNPHGSFLWPEENLLPGQKYYMIPSTTAQKLKRKYPEKVKIKAPMEPQESKEDIPDEKKIMDSGKANGKEPEPSSSAKEYLVSNARWSRPILRKGMRERKPFVPPIPKARPCRPGFGWEPSLPSVQEISP